MRFDQLAAVTGGSIHNVAGTVPTFQGVSIDSRTLAPGELFVAIRGAHRDGHEFIPQAIERGASGLVVEFDFPGLMQIPGGVPVVAVRDSHEAMIALARQYRHSLDAKFVGITGSNGKTTTKELTYHLIAAVEPTVYRSPGNLNNLFGVPLTLFRIPATCRAAVLELGISTNLEMPRLAEIVEPDLVAITNVSATHLEFLGSVEAVAKAKLDLVRSAQPNVPAIFNADDPVLMREAARMNRTFVTFAVDGAADFRPSTWRTDEAGVLTVELEGHRFRMPLAGKHQVYNLTAAYAIFRTLGYTFEGIATEDISLETAAMRGQLIERRGVRLMVDCYNANPENVKAGLAGFFAIPSRGRRVLVLGDMLELGTESPRYHREVGALLGNYTFDLAIFVGPRSIDMRDGAAAAGLDRKHLCHYPDAGALAAEIATILHRDDLVYLKASRGIGLESVLHSLNDAGKETA